MVASDRINVLFSYSDIDSIAIIENLINGISVDLYCPRYHGNKLEIPCCLQPRV